MIKSELSKSNLRECRYFLNPQMRNFTNLLNLILTVTYFLSFLTSCQIDDNMSTGAMDNLKAKLDKDPLFKEYEIAFQENVNFTLLHGNMITKFNEAIYNEGIKNVRSREDYFKLCEKAGAVNAEEQLSITYRFLKAKNDLYTKYPELNKISKENFRLLMKKSDEEIVKSLTKSRRTPKAID